MLILVCNVGSTSLKYKLYDMPKEELIVEAKTDRVGSNKGSIFSYKDYRKGLEFLKSDVKVPGYSEGIAIFLEYLTDKSNGAISSMEELEAVGFKTVHAKGFNGIHVLDEKVMEAMEQYITIAPLHNLFYIEAIRKFKEILPDKVMVGVFETAFHSTIPEEARIYGIPYSWYDKHKIKKYGFHGSSHQYISTKVKDIEKGLDFKLISCHLGGSSSICAIKNGKSIDNSFGFSTQSGVLHANRIGDIDPFIPIYMMKEENMGIEEVTQKLVYESGLLGISGVSNDLRDIEAEAVKGNERAKLSVDAFCYSVKKYIGSYFAVLGGLNYLVFTGGIGENSVSIREKICSGMEHIGIELDPDRNSKGEKERLISSEKSKVKVFIIPTNEEVIVARNVYALLDN